MIAIINTGRFPSNRHPADERQPRIYNVQINKELITTFEHDRVDGLAVCLEKAAKAVEQHDESLVDVLYKLIVKDSE